LLDNISLFKSTDDITHLKYRILDKIKAYERAYPNKKEEFNNLIH